MFKKKKKKVIYRLISILKSPGGFLGERAMVLPNEEIQTEAVVYKCFLGNIPKDESVIRDVSSGVSVCYLGLNKSSLQACASSEVTKAPRCSVSYQAATQDVLERSCARRYSSLAIKALALQIASSADNNSCLSYEVLTLMQWDRYGGVGCRGCFSSMFSLCGLSIRLVISAFAC